MKQIIEIIANEFNVDEKKVIEIITKSNSDFINMEEIRTELGEINQLNITN